MPLVPGHRIVICPRLLLCSGVFLRPFLGPVPPGPPLFVVWSFVCVFMVWAVLSLPLVCPCFVSLFLSCLAPVCGVVCCVCAFACVSVVSFLWPLWASLSVMGSFAFVLFLAAVGSPSLSLVAPSPCGWSLVVSWPCVCAGLSLWVSGCFCDGPVVLP